jgi:nicotinamide-nucleotide amidase
MACLLYRHDCAGARIGLERRAFLPLFLHCKMNETSMQSLFPDDIAALARSVHDLALGQGKRIAVAESCTGGLLSAVLTDVAGASDVYDRGFITYSNAAKHKQLGVSDDIMDTFGAVSEAVAWAMARGALERSQADLSVAITGVAGPAGGSELKPVGLVVFALAKKGDEPEQYVADSRQFGDVGRLEIRLQAVRAALELLKSALSAP